MKILPHIQPADLKKKIERLWELSAVKILSIDRGEVPGAATPVYTVQGKYTARGWTEWTQGFVYGSAILQFDAFWDPQFLQLGRSRTTERMAHHVTHMGVHDHGFNNVSTYGNLWRLMNEGRIAENRHERDFYELALKCSGAVHIPDFKMEKTHIDRRVAQMQAEGVTLRTGVMVGKLHDALGKESKVTNWAKETVTPEQLKADFDAVLLTGGAEQSRDLPAPGRELDGVHFAMEFLPQQNKINAGGKIKGQLRADGKHVVVIGGGDTGSDCVGTSNRHGAASVTQFELMPMPPEHENGPLVWPYWPIKLRTSSSHEEGCEREFAIATKEFIGGEGKDKGKVKALKAVRVEWHGGKMVEVPGSEQVMPADLVLLAMGFVSPVASVLEAFGVERDARGNAKANTDASGGYATNVPEVFAAGDMRRGQSLVVWAIREGRQAARAVDQHLMGVSELPR